MIMKSQQLLALLLTLAVTATDAFTPTRLPFKRNVKSALDVSVVSEFLTTKHNENTDTKLKAAFEKETPRSVGVEKSGMQQEGEDNTQRRRRPNKAHRNHNFATREAFLKEEPDLDFYTLHSSAVSHLHKDMPINDITRAIKRAQNRHDAHDMATIAAFLMEECDEHWGYGFRGTLLSRLAVASLHIKETASAMKAIETRRMQERASMQPFESAAIIRGLMRAGETDEGWKVLEDELPLSGMDSPDNQDLLMNRARTLASIATRNFYSVDPNQSAQALSKLSELGSVLHEANVDPDYLNLPWASLEQAAQECNQRMLAQGVDSLPDLPEDMRELVWDTMMQFPCPGGEEECSIDSYMLLP